MNTVILHFLLNLDFQPANNSSVTQALPKTFLDSIKHLPGYNEEAFIKMHENLEPITSIRLNPLKPSDAVNELLIEASVPWCAQGRYLSKRPSFTLDPVFHGGAYYVQEASSMFVDHVVKDLYKDDQPKRVLDLCAAPGGKSTLLATALPDSFIVSNEVIKTRVSILSENISKWGSDHVIVTNNDPVAFKKLPGFFDLIIVDAPCSGSGLFRKDVAAIDEWSEANVQMCSFRQRRILADIAGSLRENGFLVYSTCSYSQQEDEDICDWVVDELDLQPVPVSVDRSWGVVENFSAKHQAPAYRFYPDKVKGEGFFLACFRQQNPVEENEINHSKFALACKKASTMAEPFLKNTFAYLLADQKEIVIASLKKWANEMSIVSKILNVRKSGVAVGTVKGNDFIPNHELALSHTFSSGIPMLTLTKDEAIAYLKRQDIKVETNIKGWAICTYKCVNIGWVKVLPNRVNNYYPTNRRILMD